MKNIIIGSIIVVGLFTRQITTAQGTITYLSNLGLPSTGGNPVGSNSWLAALFVTGTNVGGYALDSVQLGLTNASGSPSGFTAMIYSAVAFVGINPGTNLETLNGSANPATSGIYTYTDASNLMLLPSTSYFIVLTAGTATNTGAYEWSITSTSSPGYNGYHWGGGQIPLVQSSDGSTWNFVSGAYPLFAIDAMPVPEPSSSFLFLLGSGVLMYARRVFRR